MQLTEPDFSRRLNISLRARVTLIVVMTPEEERVVSQIREVCEKWDPTAPVHCLGQRRRVLGDLPATGIS